MKIKVNFNNDSEGAAGHPPEAGRAGQGGVVPVHTDQERVKAG